MQLGARGVDQRNVPQTVTWPGLQGIVQVPLGLRAVHGVRAAAQVGAISAGGNPPAADTRAQGTRGVITSSDE
jgi:hypothetical protein